MIDVNQITSTLRGMPDQQLQQYAMMHKGDPYILSLAVSESNQRKKMRMAAQGQAGGMPQPKVADAAIAGMAQQQLPENQGIAQLPTPNMQRMADGGIAGYEDDEEGMATGGMGGMFNFAQQSEPVVRMSGGGVARYNGATGSVTGVAPELLGKYQQEATEMAMGTRMQFSPDVKAVVGKIQAAQEGSYLKEEQKQMLEGNPLRNKKQDSASKVAPTAPTASAAYDPTENLKKLAQTNARYTTPSAPKNAEEAAMLNRYPATKPAADKVPPAPAATSTGGVADLLPGTARLDTSYMPAAATAAPTAASAKSKASELYDSKGQIRSLEGKQAQARQDIFNQRDERVAQLDAFNKQQGPAFANYEKMLQKEELQDSTDKEKSGLMSLMKGFLAMAAGESPNAATNIAKGAMVGMGDYGDALKEFKKAAKERTKAMADIENARRAEAKGDFKDTQMYTDRANERLAASDDRFTGLISQITGKEADVAASLFNNMTNNAEETSRMLTKERGLNARAASSEARADARALMPTGEARTAMMLGTGNTQAERLKSGMMVLQELSTDKSGAKTVEMLAKINSDRAKNGEAPISMADLVNSAREYSALMYPKVTNEAPTRAR
jgi:hypothetical protein